MGMELRNRLAEKYPNKLSEKVLKRADCQIPQTIFNIPDEQVDISVGLLLKGKSCSAGRFMRRLRECPEPKLLLHYKSVCFSLNPVRVAWMNRALPSVKDRIKKARNKFPNLSGYEVHLVAMAVLHYEAEFQAGGLSWKLIPKKQVVRFVGGDAL